MFAGANRTLISEVFKGANGAIAYYSEFSVLLSIFQRFLVVREDPRVALGLAAAFFEATFLAPLFVVLVFFEALLLVGLFFATLFFTADVEALGRFTACDARLGATSMRSSGAGTLPSITLE